MPDELQREIEDILSKLDVFIPEEKAAKRLRRRWRGRTSGGWHWLRGAVARVSLAHLMVASLVLILGAFVFRSSALGQYAMIAGLVLLGLTIIISFLTSKRPAPEKRWRGQVVDLAEPGLAQRLQGWLKKRRGQ